jgi:dynein heavy chain
MKLTTKNYQRAVENCVRFGSPCLMENIEEELDPFLEPILAKDPKKKGATLLMKIGENEVVYNPDFRFFMTTKLPNPHYLPEISIKVTLVNFTVTE